MEDLVGHFLIFTIIVVAFLMVPLLIGKLLRPKLPTPEKDAIYECGEPTIGTSYVQFDLRFYVVALLFIIFDVEVAFFFPWAMIFGGATQLADNRIDEPTRIAVSQKVLNLPRNPEANDNAIPSGLPTPDQKKAGEEVPAGAFQLALTALLDILVFFGVLLVGFAYVWKRGDLDWVRAMTQKVREGSPHPKPPPTPVAPPSREPVGV